MNKNKAYKKSLGTACLIVCVLGCTDKQLPREMPHLMGEWVGEAKQRFFSECGEEDKQNIAYVAEKLIVEASNIRGVSEFIGMNERVHAAEKISAIQDLQFTAPIDNELQHGLHVSVYELNAKNGWLMPLDFNIETSGLDLRKHIVSLTERELILERVVNSRDPNASCYGEVDHRAVYKRYF